MSDALHTVKLFDRRDYDGSAPVFERHASRAIILNNGKVTLVRSRVHGYCKFPGGGIEDGEDGITALIREVSEETGLTVIKASVRPAFGITEKRRSIVDGNTFLQISDYYLVSVSGEIRPAELTAQETAEGYETAELPPAEAISVNTYVLTKSTGKYADNRSDFLNRENYALSMLESCCICKAGLVSLLQLSADTAEKLAEMLSTDSELHKKLSPAKQQKPVSGTEMLSVTSAWITKRHAEYYCIALDGEVCGSVSLADINQDTHTAGCGYWLGSRFWGKGIMTAAFGLILKKSKQLGLKKLTASITEDTPASAEIWRHCGAEMSLLNGRYTAALLL